MCGISGSCDRTKAFQYYRENLKRGFYSSGSVVLDEKLNWRVYKRKDEFQNTLGQPTDQYTLVHSRAPTSETTEFNPVNNHPFFFGDWIIAHNGIISNFNELSQKLFPDENFTGKTDSCIIPRLLHREATIPRALEQLKGTFAVWAFNIRNKQIYVARSGVTLFGNPLTGDFSSSPFEDSIALEEGKVYWIESYRKLSKIFSFKSTSPYFVL